MCVQATKTANRFEISSLLEKMLLKKLTIPERWQAVGMHNGGFSHRRVADHFRVNHSFIVRLMQRFRQTVNVTDRPRAGRPRKTTPREDHLIHVRIIHPK
jgi:transposase